MPDWQPRRDADAALLEKLRRLVGPNDLFRPCALSFAYEDDYGRESRHAVVHGLSKVWHDGERWMFGVADCGGPFREYRVEQMTLEDA